MARQLVSCDTCDHKLVSDSLFCPRCLSYRREASEGWFPIDGTGSDNPVVNHDYVPEHRVYPEKKVQELMREYNIDRTKLPKIQKSDPALDHLKVADGDVIKIIRDSRTANKSEIYRLVISDDGQTRKRSTEAWRNPDDPAEEIFEVSEKVTEEQARHILSNTRAHVPPANPGTCRRIAVNRTDEIKTAIERARSGEPYTFIQGEFGYGKSFFLYWLRDMVLSSSVVSIIDLGDDTTFNNPSTVTQAFQDHLESPRSLANEDYANGLDELWDTFLRQVSDVCAGYYERQGFQIRRDRMVESIRRATESLLQETEISNDIREKLVKAATDHFDGSLQSLSHSLLGTISDEGAFERLKVIAALARLNGYRVLLGVDELEKADRSTSHFEAIVEFIDMLPANISLFITGTPELVEGGKEGNAFRGSFPSLYDRTVKNRIVLDRPSQDHLVEFTERLLELESRSLPAEEREYTGTVNKYEDSENAVSRFLDDNQPTFRDYLGYLERSS